MKPNGKDIYQTWLWGELALLGLLASAFATFAAYEALQTAYELPELRLVIATTVMLASLVVALLAGALAVGVAESFASFWSGALKDVSVFRLLIPVLLLRTMLTKHAEEEVEEIEE